MSLVGGSRDEREEARLTRSLGSGRKRYCRAMTGSKRSSRVQGSSFKTLDRHHDAIVSQKEESQFIDAIALQATSEVLSHDASTHLIGTGRAN